MRPSRGSNRRVPSAASLSRSALNALASRRVAKVADVSTQPDADVGSGTQIGAGRSRQRGVGVSEVVHAHCGMPEFGDPCPPANGTLPVLEPEPRALRRHDGGFLSRTPLDSAFRDRHQPFRNWHAAATGAALWRSLNEASSSYLRVVVAQSI
jgi:hypothetical protein